MLLSPTGVVVVPVGGVIVVVDDAGDVLSSVGARYLLIIQDMIQLLFFRVALCEVIGKRGILKACYEHQTKVRRVALEAPR